MLQQSSSFLVGCYGNT